MTLFIMILLLAILIPLSIITLYYIILAIISFAIPSHEGTKKNADPTTRFAIVIPAHNEEKTIGKTLGALNALSYPEKRYEIIVIADNCSDRTVDIAKKEGARVLERENETLKGKGYALTFAFEKILESPIDAILVLDADCTIDPFALTVFDTYLKRGKRVLQANDVIGNPDESAMTYALAVGNTIENALFYAPKSVTGLCVFLRGTGMVFDTSLLKQIPWMSASLAEDADYTMVLTQKNIPVTFIEEVKVSSDFPATQTQLNTQRDRWAKGNLALGKRHAIPAMFNGLKNKHLRLFDMGITLLALSRPLILLFSGIAFIIAFLLFFISCGFPERVFFSWSLMIVLLLIGYFLTGIFVLGLNKKRLFYLLQSPVIIMRLLKITLKGFLRDKKKVWEKTPR